MTSKSIILFGLHAVEALLNKHPERILQLYIQAARDDSKMIALLQQAEKLGIAIQKVPRATLEKMTDAANHQGIVASCKPLSRYTEHDLSFLLKDITSPLILVLDGVQDPHNLGACFRTSDAAGVHLIMAPQDKSASITSVVSKVASGAVETIPFVQVTNLVRGLEQLKALGCWIYGASEEASQTVYETKLSGPIALVLGAEGTGLRRLTQTHCDGLIRIPMQGSVGSLNVSVAAGVMLFEIYRQRTIFSL